MPGAAQETTVSQYGFGTYLQHTRHDIRCSEVRNTYIQHSVDESLTEIHGGGEYMHTQTAVMQLVIRMPCSGHTFLALTSAPAAIIAAMASGALYR